MKIYVTSDIHLEFGDCMIKNEDDAQVLILSGDIMVAQDMHDHPDMNSDMQSVVNIPDLGRRQATALRFRDFLKRCSFQFPHVVYVAGNHEFYHGKWPLGVEYLRSECGKFPNVHFLEKDTVTIDDVTFVGGTLWTDMNKFDPITLHSVRDMMNDFRVIRNSDKGFRHFSPADAAQRHKETVGYIKTVVEGNPNGKFVVVGHHAPSFLSVHKQYKNDHIMNGAYYSDLSELILDHPQICLWTHGHTHEDFDYMIGDTRVICNPRGYIGYETRAYNWQPKLVEI